MSAFDEPESTSNGPIDLAKLQDRLMRAGQRYEANANMNTIVNNVIMCSVGYTQICLVRIVSSVSHRSLLSHKSHNTGKFEHQLELRYLGNHLPVRIRNVGREQTPGQVLLSGFEGPIRKLEESGEGVDIGSHLRTADPSSSKKVGG